MAFCWKLSHGKDIEGLAQYWLGGAAGGEVQAWQLADDGLWLALHDEVKILREEIREMKAKRAA